MKLTFIITLVFLAYVYIMIGEIYCENSNKKTV